MATAVTVSEVPPGHDVLIFSIAREVGQYYATLVRRDKVLSPQPGSRTVNWDLGKPVPPQSVWCAIDLANGETVLASPPGFPLRRIIDAPLISRDSAGAPSRIVHERADAFVIVATPGRGAWILRSGDGGGGDDDPSPGKARVALTRLGPLVRNGAPPPSVLSASDVVVVIDPIYLEVWSGQVGREVQP